jgi:hypothetical protein
MIRKKDDETEVKYATLRLQSSGTLCTFLYVLDSVNLLHVLHRPYTNKLEGEDGSILS